MAESKGHQIVGPTTRPARATRRGWIGLAVIALPCLLYAMDLTVLTLAVTAISSDLRPSTELLWIVDIYGFLVAGFLITMGTLGDRIGRRRLTFPRNPTSRLQAPPWWWRWSSPAASHLGEARGTDHLIRKFRHRQAPQILGMATFSKTCGDVTTLSGYCSRRRWNSGEENARPAPLPTPTRRR
jgi:hypothetical protein